MKLLLEAKPGERVDGALVSYYWEQRGSPFLCLTWRVVLRLSSHYALAVRFVPADSDLRKHSWLARWTRLQFRLLWFPYGAPFVSRETAEALGLRSDAGLLGHLLWHGLIKSPRWYTLVPDLEREGWYARRAFWPRKEDPS